MASAVASLKSYYSGLHWDRVKIETHAHGFSFLDTLLSKGASLEYGELTGHKLLHKYKLTGVSPEMMERLLEAHVKKSLNVCLYFHESANQMFCFNLDNNHKTNNTESIPEVEVATEALRTALVSVGIKPLVIASGRGYHLWCRLEQAVENSVIYELMVRLAATALLHVHKSGHDGQKVKFNFYPDPRSIDVVSLRLFGSEHAKTHLFSRVKSTDGLLDEASSWNYLSELIGQAPTPLEVVIAAHRSAMKAF